jgi:hypothetical protein
MAAALGRLLQNDSVLYTASGDQHVGVWDASAGRLMMYCAGHDGSVKAVCPHSSQPDIFASGAHCLAPRHILRPALQLPPLKLLCPPPASQPFLQRWTSYPAAAAASSAPLHRAVPCHAPGGGGG